MGLLDGIGKVVSGGFEAVKSVVEVPVDAAVTGAKLVGNAVSLPLDVAKNTVVGAGKTVGGVLTLNPGMVGDGLSQATVGNVREVVDHVAINPAKIVADGLNDQWENLTGKRISLGGPTAPEGGMPGAVPGVPGAVPGMTGAVPGVPGAVPGMAGAVPGVARAVPGMAGAVPGMAGAVPGVASGGFPATTGGFPDYAVPGGAFGEYYPGTTQNWVA